MKKLIMILMIASMASAIFAEGSISGVSYFGYSMKHMNADDEDNKDRGFELNRVYLTYKKEISEKASFTFQADMQNKFDDNTAYYMYIKKAQLDLKVADGTKFIIGMQGMNMFNVAEKTWGNRFISKSAIDEEGWSASADLGMGISQSFGDLSASLLVTNGEGYKKISSDNNEKISLQAMYGEKRLDKNDGFNIGGVYSSLTYTSVEDDAATIDIDEEEEKAGTVMGVFAGFSGFGARVGFDYSMGTDLDLEFIEDKDDPDYPDVDETTLYGESSTLMSFYANYSLSFIDGLSVMGRYDMLDANVKDNVATTSMDESAEDNVATITAGLIYNCTDGFTVAPHIVQTTEGTGDPMMDFNLSFQFKF